MKKMKIKNGDFFKMLSYYFDKSGTDISDQHLYSAIVSLNSLGKFEFYDENEACHYYLLKIKPNEKDPEKIASKLLNSFNKTDRSKILIIVNNIQDKLYINDPKYKKLLKDNLTKKLLLNKRISTIEDISAEFISDSNKKYTVTISNRVDSLSYELNQEDNKGDQDYALGYVYIASLRDVVDMYNTIGDALFDLNVRYGIADELNVEKEIKKTLSNCPEKFWFYNNGITVIVNQGGFECKNPYSVEFKYSSKFSVINGAQTITTAAKWYNSETQEKRENLNKAKVLLRIIVVKDMNYSFAKDISVSLNRQKSIAETDIANTYEFVKEINKYMNQCENDEICFEINKRGGTPSYSNSYYINNFAQLVKAYLGQKPGLARNSKGALIIGTTKNGKYVFDDTDIFKEIKSPEDIEKYYTPVNYASELNNSYKAIAKHITPDSSIKGAILKYCNMYCIASVIYCINNKNCDDFSNFKYIDIEYNDKIIETFIDLFEKFLVNNKITLIDSNNFKKDSLYKEFKDSNYMEVLYNYITTLKQ